MSLTRACGVFGCGENKPCPTHRKKPAAFKQKSARERGYKTSWDRYRKSWLAKHPLCGDRRNGMSDEHSICRAEGINMGAPLRKMHVDHIVPHGGDKALFDDPANHQTLCEKCHNRKTATEDGGFIRRIPGERIVVTGVPGSGKTTWVRQRARPGDIVLDLDEIAGVITRVPRYPRPKDAMRALLVMRDALIAWLEKATVLVHVYLIVTDVNEASAIAQRIHGRLQRVGFAKEGGGKSLTPPFSGLPPQPRMSAASE